MPVIEEIVEEPPIDDVEPGRGDECSMICDQKLEWGERLKAAGNAWFKRGDLDKAIGKYRRGTKIFEMLYAVFKDDEEGAQAANERCYVAAAPLYNNLALCLYKQGKWKECADACTDNLDLTPTDVKSLLRRAAARAEIDMWEEADDDIAKALRLDPDRQVGQAERREHQEDTPGAPDQASHERPRRHRWQDPGHEPVRRR